MIHSSVMDKRFKDRWESVDQPHQLNVWSTFFKAFTKRTHEDIEHEQPAVIESQHLTVWGLEDLGIPQTSVSEILTEDLGMKLVAAKFFALLSQEQKTFFAEVAQVFSILLSDRDFLRKVTTEDKLWVYGYDPETRAHSSQYESKLWIWQSQTTHQSLTANWIAQNINECSCMHQKIPCDRLPSYDEVAQPALIIVKTVEYFLIRPHIQE